MVICTYLKPYLDQDSLQPLCLQLTTHALYLSWGHC